MQLAHLDLIVLKVPCIAKRSDNTPYKKSRNISSTNVLRVESLKALEI